MSLSAKRRWRSSEEIALRFLEEQGFRILDTHYKIKIEGVEIGEVDAIVEDEQGNKYAVEIKAGRIDVTGIRQAYVNAQLLGYKPLVVAKGFSDESAALLAEKLGVKVIQLSDYFLVESEELETLIKASIRSIIEEFLNALLTTKNLGPEETDFLITIAQSRNIKEVADKLGISVEEVARRIKRLQNKGILSKKIKSFQEIRFYAQLLLLRENMRKALELIKSCCRNVE
ncbi:MAG: YraN family protein [Staphylothermus sp.]|nr:YraN family protein [Staphylothermus sp.]